MLFIGTIESPTSFVTIIRFASTFRTADINAVISETAALTVFCISSAVTVSLPPVFSNRIRDERLVTQSRR